MKKNILAIIGFCTLFSCTEVLDDHEFLSTNQKEVAKDTAAYDESIVNRISGSYRNLGLHVTEQELVAWRQRASSGPYKTKGDVSLNSPGEWERLTAFAQKFRENPNSEIWYGNSVPEPHNNHHKLLSAAFVSLVSNDKALAVLVKNQLLRQARLVGVGKLYFIGHHNGFHTANWLLRLLYAYDYIKGYCTASEKVALNNWFRSMGYFFAKNTNNTLTKYFPNRLAQDYTRRLGAASNGGFNNDLFTHVQKDGKKMNRIYWIHKQYNNRIASKVRFAGMVGVFLNDASLIHHGKIYVKEFFKFGVFPDGTMAEYERNGDYGSPQTGAMYYGAINIEVVINLADALARKGDYELYNYSTSEGIYGTQGGNKNLPLVIKAYLQNLNGEVKRFYRYATTLNLIDYNDERQKNRNIAFDIMFSQTQWFYNDDYVEKCYLRKLANSPQYSGGSYWHAVSIWWPWSGVTATMPSYPFMFAKMVNSSGV